MLLSSTPYCAVRTDHDSLVETFPVSSTGVTHLADTYKSREHEEVLDYNNKIREPLDTYVKKEQYEKKSLSCISKKSRGPLDRATSPSPNPKGIENTKSATNALSESTSALSQITCSDAQSVLMTTMSPINAPQSDKDRSNLLATLDEPSVTAISATFHLVNPSAAPQKRASILKQGTRSSIQSPSTTSKERRVKGLWNSETREGPFDSLRGALIVDRIFSYLQPQDLLRSSMACRRWNYLAKDPSLWKVVDATDFVKHLYQTHQQKKQDESSKTNSAKDQHAVFTSQALSQMLERFKVHIEKLTIRDIQHYLIPEIAMLGMGECLSTGRLVDLHLTRYDLLTDTHVNILLLAQHMQPLPRKQRPRHHLTCFKVEHCKLLTDSVTRIVARQCPKLIELSLCGNTNISDAGLMVLKDSIAIEGTSAAPKPQVAFASMFAPPSPTTARTTFASVFDGPTKKTPPRRFGSIKKLNIDKTGITREGLKQFVRTLTLGDDKTSLLEKLNWNGNEGDKFLQEKN